MKTSRLSPLLAVAGLALCSGQAHASLITNGDFETGDFTGWTRTTPTASSIVSGGSALDGSFSATLVGDPGPNGNIRQSFAPVTVNTAVSGLVFSMPDPGGAGDRGLNVFFGEAGDTGQINLRVVDVGNDGDGDVQVFNGAWQTILLDAVTFGATTTLQVAMRDFGASANYDVMVGSQTITGVSFFQNSVLNNFDEVTITNQFGIGAFTVDNVFAVAIPEPSTLGVLAIGVSGLFLRRRRRRVLSDRLPTR